MYKGWIPSVLGVIPYVGLNFAVYETLKASLLTHYGELGAYPKGLLWVPLGLPNGALQALGAPRPLEVLEALRTNILSLLCAFPWASCPPAGWPR